MTRTLPGRRTASRIRPVPHPLFKEGRGDGKGAGHG